MTLPNFFVIGAARSGTTALYSYLCQHPQIFMSPIKELNFFASYGRPMDYQGPGDRAALEKTWIRSMQEYEAQFARARDEIAIGEASPWYLYVPEVPERIHRQIPAAKIVVMLRNPVDRAYSAFTFLRQQAREPEEDFLRALDRESERIAAHWEPLWHYRSMGLYYEQVTRYIDHFDRDRIRVYIYDEFERNPRPIMADIFRFLGVDDAFVPDVSERPNESNVPKSHRLHALFMQLEPLMPVIRRWLPSATRRRMRTATYTRPPRITPEARRQLVKAFQEDVVKLEALLNRDLSSWLEGDASPGHA